MTVPRSRVACLFAAGLTVMTLRAAEPDARAAARDALQPAEGAFVTAENDPQSGDERETPPLTVPEKYTLDYPAAERFCPPVRSTFYEVTRTVETLGPKKFAHPLNGGFGFRMQQKVNGRPLIHVGADLGWFRVGEPVFAVADGVVRLSTGPTPPDKRESRKPKASPAAEAPQGPAQSKPKVGGFVVPWGNVVAIEHRLADGEYVTTIYGHLGTDRRVKTGDVVRAGQLIGTIGRRNPFINGGYKPHLHFGVRQGRLAEVGRGVLPLDFGAGPVIARIAAIDENELELDPGQPLPDGAGEFRLTIGGSPCTIRRRGERLVVPARILWTIPTTPEFPLVGYALSTEGFLDPVGFLRTQSATARPAAYLPLSAKPK